ncbi:MAG: hypothetical protein HY760_02640, partial [Nitrospirae bacterium]|nr:hypothetical protein [Nitrospirota bacterium]
MGQDEQEKLAAQWEAQLTAEEEKGEAPPPPQPQPPAPQAKAQPQARPAEFSPLKESAPADPPN